MLSKFIVIFFLLSTTTYLRYFEIFSINIYLVVVPFSFLLMFWEAKELKINKRISIFFIFIVYCFFNLVFLSERYNSFALLFMAISSIWLWHYISKNGGWENIITATLILFLIHIIISFLQKYTSLEAVYISKFFGFFENSNDGQILKHRVPGLSFISGDFYASISLALAYLYKKRKTLFFISVLAIGLVNISKVFIPSIIILILYDQFVAKRNGVTPWHLILLVFFINFFGFYFSYLQYKVDPSHMSTFSSRVIYLYYLAENVASSPLFGIGFDKFKAQVDIIYAANSTLYFPHNPHNVFIKFISELGVFGGGLYILSLFVTSYVPPALKKNEKVIIIQYSIFLVLVQLSFHNFHFMNDLYIYLGILSGLIYRLTGDLNVKE